MSPALITGLEPVVAHGLVRTFGARRVLDGIDLTVAPGTRLGLIGENGTGKSTLLRLLAGVDRPDAGSVGVPSDLVYLPQEPGADASTVGRMLDDALRPLHDAVGRLEELAARMATEDGADVAAEYDAVLAWAVTHDAWDADRRAEVTAATLGVADLDRDRPVATLSGGQRTRLALAAALVRRPAVLLLDEPTNHLDEAALDLLERSLVELPGVVVAVSHDRTFLDRVATELVDLDAGVLGTDGRGGQRFGGSFTAYLVARADSRRRWEETFAAQQEEIAALRERTRVDLRAVAAGRGPTDNDKFVTKFKGAGVERARARRVHDAERRLEVAEREALPKPPEPLRFAAPLTGGAATVSVRDLQVTGRLHLPRLDVGTGEKLLVTGPNGTGKSTLLDVLAGHLVPDAGWVRVGARRVALVRQDPVFARDDLPARDAFAEAVGAEVAEAVPLRSLGLLHPRDHGTAVGALSVGQRRRLSLAIAVAVAPDLLLLDEPTNHLSLRLAGELESAVAAAAGTVVVTSHDRWLRSRWSGPTLDLGVGGAV
ncbi:ABC-F family ATP-binding cassette domain-containing protein [Actinomycetospora soli]|uniref:ABC-F family ATP-binding cassette domain-containing protein n=1 Tax=Actinomycetospora soli TaxID=2893887 RepID=UPI001E6031C7|nr:ABC-F family ATP-binding cassette domain-containing protein [Actinomycetospora soli]MCD2186522.1 ATP-binding cassette domain-containing protein [Actinomycetospora soli]